MECYWRIPKQFIWKEEVRKSQCWLPRLCGGLPLKSLRLFPPSATVTAAGRENTPVCVFIRRKWHFETKRCFKPGQVFFRPPCIFGTSRTFISRLSQPLVTFLSRSFQSWSRLISMTVFATSWTTLFLPSTSCINSSSTPVWVSIRQTFMWRTHQLWEPKLSAVISVIMLVLVNTTNHSAYLRHTPVVSFILQVMERVNITCQVLLVFLVMLLIMCLLWNQSCF